MASNITNVQSNNLPPSVQSAKPAEKQSKLTEKIKQYAPLLFAGFCMTATIVGLAALFIGLGVVTFPVGLGLAVIALAVALVALAIYNPGAGPSVTEQMQDTSKLMEYDIEALQLRLESEDLESGLRRNEDPAKSRSARISGIQTVLDKIAAIQNKYPKDTFSSLQSEIDEEVNECQRHLAELRQANDSTPTRPRR